MRAAITIGLMLIPVLLWIGIDYASKSHDRQVKQLWADEEAIIRSNGPTTQAPGPKLRAAIECDVIILARLEGPIMVRP